jgi:hypothetical protein
MRIATYNVEWFDHLFDESGNLMPDDQWSGRYDVTRIQQIEALIRVFSVLDADAVMVIEAPDSHHARDGVAALETFAEAAGLRARKALIGFANQTQQEISLLYDPDVITARHDPKGGKAGEPGIPRFDEEYRIDLNTDASPDPVRWSKPPLEVAFTPKGRDPIRVIGVHAKSKAPHGARSEAEVMRISIDNRRKQLAQCIWLRARVAEHLEAEDPLIVLGDFNDGPGLDEYEKLFGQSGVEIVMGEGNGPRLFDPHARQALSRRIVATPSTARFRIHPEGRYLSALLDYIMISPDLMALRPAWRIWHPFDDPECFADPELCRALQLASDHFPVSLDIEM